MAWVPVGSLTRGAALVTSQAPACEPCHGAGLRGLTVAPPIAGRSASYAMRQLYEFKAGVRSEGNAALMKPIVEKRSMDDLTAIVAYLSSLPP
ncbi:MAG: c-type cytochrome [Myxococcales bacterium]|nr:c-type cytochrome [Myxococcales bacterium]